MQGETSHFIVCGGCHLDRHLRLHDDPLMGRTNPASHQIRAGGVAANIARHLATHGANVEFLGVQPQSDLALMESYLHADNVRPRLLALEGEVPGYTAIISAEGELVFGAAAMSLYDKVDADLFLAALGQGNAPLVLDANFPQETLTTLAKALDHDRPLLAAATSSAKVRRFAECLGRLDALVLNRGEAAMLTHNGPVAEMASMLAARLRTGGCVLVSDGGHEAALASGGNCVVAKPPAIQLANVNGAGDAMAAALFWGLVAKAETDLAARLDQALVAGADFAAGNHVERSG